MQLTSYNSETFYLFTPQPNWQRNVQLTLQLPSKNSQGKSDRQATRPSAEALRVPNYRFSTWLEGEELLSLLASLEQRTTERLLVPVWTEVYGRKFEAGLYLHYRESDEHEIETWALSTEATSAEEDNGLKILPLIIADFKEDPRAALKDDELVEYEFSFEEDAESEYALRLIGGYTSPLGPSVGAKAYPYLPLQPNYEQGQTAGSVEVLMGKARELGSGRRLHKEYEGAPPSRPMTLGFECFDEQEAWEFLSFWEQRKGAVERFWISSQLAPARLAERTTGATNTLKMESVAYLKIGQHVLIENLTEASYYTATITELSGTEVTLDKLVGDEAGLEVSHTHVRELILCHFETSFLKLSWDTDETFRTRLEVREVKPELLEVEAIGSTIGALPMRRTLYTVYDKAGYEAYYTSHEKAVQYEGKSFASYPMEHGSITSTINLSDRTTLKVQAIKGSPFMEFANVQSEAFRRLFLKLERVELVDGVVSSVKKTFIGELLKPELARGQGQLKITCAAISRDLEKKAPAFKHQRQCNYTLYSPSCGLNREDWQHAATVVSVDVSNDSILVNFAPGVNDDKRHTLLGGYVEVNGLRNTIKADVTEGTNLRLYLMSSELPAVGEVVTIQSGCDGSEYRCKKFGNYAQWGGNLNAKGNLSLVRVSSNASGGGKK